MACYWKSFAVGFASAALVSAVSPAFASPPVGSRGCEGTAVNRVAGEFTHNTWPISQKRRVDGSEVRRTYTVHVPSQHRGDTPLPIVFDLHVSFSSGFQQNLISEMGAKGAAEGFIVVQPDSWPWWATSPIEEALRGGISDVEYIKLLLDTFDQSLCFDRNRIFVAGGGLIGVMAPAVGCASAKGELGAHRIAAVATVSTFAIPTFQAPPWEKVPNSNDVGGWLTWIGKKWVKICPERGQDFLPLMVIVSDNDQRLASLVATSTAPERNSQSPDTSGSNLREDLARFVERGIGRPPAEDVLKGACVASAFWAIENKCLFPGGFPIDRCADLAGPPGAPAENSWGVEKQRIEASCGGNSRKHVQFIVFGTGSTDRNGHIWPGKPAGTPFSATDAIWTFFREHPR